jgi:hypothetical protein
MPEAPGGVLLLVIAMPEMMDFFQKQVEECRRLAAQASGKNDRQYWSRLAQRWEWLIQPQKKDVDQIESVRPLRSNRSALAKRFGKQRAA